MEQKNYEIELLRQKIKLFQEQTGLIIKKFCVEIDFDPNEFSKIINGHKKNIDAYLIGRIIKKYPSTNALWFFVEGVAMNREEPNTDDLASKNKTQILHLSKALESVLAEIRSLKDTVGKL